MINIDIDINTTTFSFQFKNFDGLSGAVHMLKVLALEKYPNFSLLRSYLDTESRKLGCSTARTRTNDMIIPILIQEPHFNLDVVYEFKFVNQDEVEGALHVLDKIIICADLGLIRLRGKLAVFHKNFNNKD